GTTSAVVLAGALLEKAEELLDKNVHPTVIVDGYKKAAEKAKEILNNISITVDPKDKEWLMKVAKTSMATKLVSAESEYLAGLIVDAILSVVEEQDGKLKVDIDNVKVEKKAGGSLLDTKLIKGIALDKEVVHSGMPK
ncbi:MAG: thermosome subunit, partial [Nitrososphaeria archaeon]|nr:thermosome subunit [Nitrososphaeria archaeon]